MKTEKLIPGFAMAFALAMLLPAFSADAAPDYEVHNITESIGGTWASANSDVLIGPNAQITVNGDWYITANNFYIHPSAVITGTGTLHIMNPSTYYGKTAATTMMDGGSVMIGCKVSIENGSTVTLTAIDPASAYAASGFTETAPHLAMTSLGIGSALNFNNAGAHVILGSNNVVLGSVATITYTDLNTAAYSPDPTPATASQAYLVTGGTGVVTKQGLAANTAFTFPIGQSANTDYTPGVVTNGSTVQDVNLAVKDYTGSAASETATAVGNGRSWLLYTSSGAALSGLALTHNTVTNGSSYVPAQASIIRQQTTAGVWSSPGATAYGGLLAATGETGNPATLTSVPNAYYNNTLVLGATATTAANNAWYSKSSDVLGGVQLVSSAFLQGGMNAGNTAMRNDLQVAGLLPTQSTAANSLVPLKSYSNINNTSGAAGTVTDWVEVQLRAAASPSVVAERRSFLVRNNGTIVNPDGTTTLRFSSPPGNYYVVVDHRNHFPVSTGIALAMTEAAATTVDFRSPATATYLATGNNAAQATAGSFRAVWGGDVNNDNAIYYNATGNDKDNLLSAYLGGDEQGYNSAYERGDVNLDGQTYFNATGNDKDWLLLKPLNGDEQNYLETQAP